MVTRSTELAEKYFEYAIKVIEGNPFVERQAAQEAAAAAENYYKMVSETPLPYVFDTGAAVDPLKLFYWMFHGGAST